MPNTQAPEKRARTDGQVLDVHSVFYTIQGEGPYAGRPAVFVRLAGCNLQCPACDTEYTTGRRAVPIDELALDVRQQTRIPGSASPYNPYHRRPYDPLVVITGGEPMRQDLLPFVLLLDAAGYLVQVETNGSFTPSRSMLFSRCDIVCSPKTATVHSTIRDNAVAWKYVLHADSVADDGLPRVALAHPIRDGQVVARPPEYFPACNIYVQPIDVGDAAENRRHLQAAIRSSMQHGYTLGHQMHKHVGLP